ncbi:hypothetical protein EDC01DRAFT_635805 [Geopyxis carbonaria]|nr:hypothetical protein EDC01DRAFT_635805 [Geopyxis carbonaria]
MPPTRRSKRLLATQHKHNTKSSTTEASNELQEDNTQETAINISDDDSQSPTQANLLSPTMSTQGFEIHTASTTAEIQAYLESIDLPGWYIYPAVISFNDEAHKGNQILRNERSLIKGGVPKDYITVQNKDLDRCHTLTTAFRYIKNTGTILWMSGSMWQLEKGGDPAWHSFLFLYKNRKVVMIDPDYATGPGRLRLTSLGGGLELGRKLLRMMEGHKGVDARWIGKGVPDHVSSTGVNCNDLTFMYLEQFVKDQGKWDRDWASEGFDVVYK